MKPNKIKGSIQIHSCEGLTSIELFTQTDPVQFMIDLENISISANAMRFLRSMNTTEDDDSTLHFITEGGKKYLLYLGDSPGSIKVLDGNDKISYALKRSIDVFNRQSKIVDSSPSESVREAIKKKNQELSGRLKTVMGRQRGHLSVVR